MEPAEIELQVADLETRMERLRVLYDQFFQGIEKIPPSVVQKDVDRRIWSLRKERIRNTGIRFKFQTLCQRYNTLQAHWTRILREIEAGTFRRHVDRAKKRFGADAGNVAAGKTSGVGDRDDNDSFDVDVDAEDRSVTIDVGESSEIDLGPEISMREAMSIDVDDANDDGGIDTGSLPPPAVEAVRPRAVAPTPRTAPLGGLPARPVNGSGAMGSPPGASPSSPSSSPSSERTPRPIPSPFAATSSPRMPAAPPAAAPPRPVRPPIASDTELDDLLDGAFGVKPAAPKPVAPRAAPVAMVAGPRAPFPQSAPKPVAIPSAAAPAPRETPVARPAGGAPEDFREVYSRYVDAKRKNGESTASLTYESLAKSLADTREKLKTKAGGKAVDFEIGTKDGKTILKPVVR